MWAKEWRSVCGVAAVEMPAEAVDEDHVGLAIGVVTACDLVTVGSGFSILPETDRDLVCWGTAMVDGAAMRLNLFARDRQAAPRLRQAAPC
jgi:hypothetical protein